MWDTTFPDTFAQGVSGAKGVSGTNEEAEWNDRMMTKRSEGTE